MSGFSNIDSLTSRLIMDNCKSSAENCHWFDTETCQEAACKHQQATLQRRCGKTLEEHWYEELSGLLQDIGKISRECWRLQADVAL